MIADTVSEVLDRTPVPFLPLKLAIIGVDVPGFPCFEPSIYGWRDALYKFRSRNLWLPEGFGITDQVLLEGNGFLNILGGGGPNLGNCERAFNDGPMFFSPKGNRWGLTVSGFSVDARPDVYGANLLNHTWDIQEMFFGKWINCQTNGSGGNNWNLRGDIQCVTFDDTISSDAFGFGYRLENATNVHWIGGAGAAERNRLGNLLWEATSSQPYTGIGTIRHHFEAGGGPAIDLRRIHSVSVCNSYTYLAGFKFDDECRNLEFRHNELVSWGLGPDGFPADRIVGPRSGHSIGQNTYVDLESGKVYPDPDDTGQNVQKQFQRSVSLMGWNLGIWR